MPDQSSGERRRWTLRGDEILTRDSMRPSKHVAHSAIIAAGPKLKIREKVEVVEVSPTEAQGSGERRRWTVYVDDYGELSTFQPLKGRKIEVVEVSPTEAQGSGERRCPRHGEIPASEVENGIHVPPAGQDVCGRMVEGSGETPCTCAPTGPDGKGRVWNRDCPRHGTHAQERESQGSGETAARLRDLADDLAGSPHMVGDTEADVWLREVADHLPADKNAAAFQSGETAARLRPDELREAAGYLTSHESGRAHVIAERFRHLADPPTTEGERCCDLCGERLPDCVCGDPAPTEGEGLREALERGGEQLAVAVRGYLAEAADDDPDHPVWNGPLAQGLKAWNEARNALRPDADAQSDDTPEDGCPPHLLKNGRCVKCGDMESDLAEAATPPDDAKRGES